MGCLGVWVVFERVGRFGYSDRSELIDLILEEPSDLRV